MIAMIKQRNINDCQKQFTTFAQLVNELNIPQYLREQENTAIQRIKDTNAEIEQEIKQLEEQRANIPQGIKDLVS
jgi:DNA-directed RNA polymerase specialized sigma subunit